MRLTRRATLFAVATLVLSPVAAGAATPAAPQPAAAFQPWLDRHLTTLADDATLRVAVRGTSLDAATAAVDAAGLGVQQTWELVDTVVAIGTAEQVEWLRGADDILRVEGDRPLTYNLDTAHQATRSDEALATYEAADGGDVDGTGVTIAVIDSGIDGTHPMFQRDGATTVVRNLKNVCGTTTFTTPGLNETCFQQIPTNDTDTISAGGHGTHVSGIAAGVPVTTTAPAGTELRGSGSGANLVGLSVGAAIGLLDAQAAQNWVLEHQQNPCRSAAEQSVNEVDPECPPIRVTNHSYGPIEPEEGGNSFDENAIAVTLQRALVEKGVVAVWAAGNSGGDGSIATTNPTAMDPTPGIVMVASYDDGQNGNPNNTLSSFSSRGEKDEPDTYPDLAAPGDRITSACRPTLTVCTGNPSFDGGNYQTISGTSMASPYVAGVVAQLLEANPALMPGEVENILEDTAHKFTSGGAYESDPHNPDDTTSFDKGHGLVDVLAALGAVVGAGVDEQPLGEPVPARCDGTDLVTDDAGDTNAPGGTGAPAPAQDIVAISFSAADDVLTVTNRYADLAMTPAPGSTSTNHYATWLAPDGVRYGVFHSTPGGGYSVGEFDVAANRLKTGTTSAVTGTFTPGPDGTVAWEIPFALVGSPVVPVDQTTDPDAEPAVQDAFGVTIAGVGALGSGLVYVAPVDRAPDGGATPAWSVCSSEPLEQDPVEPDPVDPDEGDGTTCEPKGNGKGNGGCPDRRPDGGRP